MKVYETERRRKRDYFNTLATQGKETVQTLDRMRKVKRTKQYKERESLLRRVRERKGQRGRMRKLDREINRGNYRVKEKE